MKKLKTKSGAASFYIVIFTTLIFGIIVAGFASAIITEIVRSSNEQLSQSAYDAAMAGVEDAKIAYIKYRNCLSNKSAEGCTEIIKAFDSQDCESIPAALGRNVTADSGVILEESTSSDGNKSQAYTCLTISNPDDYLFNLNASNTSHVIALNSEEAATAKSIVVRWYSDSNGKDIAPQENLLFDEASTHSATPPVIAVQLTQSASGKNLQISDLTTTTNNTQTDRGTVYLVPSSVQGALGYGESINSGQIIASNDRTTTNTPQAVTCDANKSFMCSVTLELPEPVNGLPRSKDTFILAISLPYAQTDTDFSISLCTESGNCVEQEEQKSESEPASQTISMKDIQIEIDSTGRAQDLFRRVKVRMNTNGTSSASGSVAANTNLNPNYAIWLYGDAATHTASLEKNLSVTSEFGI